MSKYQTFHFKSYAFNPQEKSLTLNYSYDNELNFTETYRFDFDFIDYDTESLERACELLFFMAGISYYKMYLAPEIIIENGAMDETLANFFSKTYQKGLGEFFYVNKLDPGTKPVFPVTSDPLPQITTSTPEGLLVGIGGGKDSLVSAELLRNHPNIATWSLNHRSQLQPLVERIGLKHFYVERKIDSQITELNKQGAYNGHVPISAIIACTGLIVSILSGYSDHVVSNESSASEPNLEYQGESINHQYSKSLEFEQDFQKIIGSLFPNVWYFSLLRPFSELHIAQIFATKGWFEKYKDVFSSCNKAFTHTSNHIFWDGTCPKCAFVFLALTPFIERSELEHLFNDSNLLLNPELETTYRQLLGIEGDKPLECVGEVKESRAAMRLAAQQYPELEKYSFEIPEDYNWLAWNQDALSDTMRKTIAELLREQPE